MVANGSRLPGLPKVNLSVRAERTLPGRADFGRQWSGFAAASNGATSFNYAISGLVDWPVAALFIVSGVLGGALGLRGARALSSGAALARRLFARFILIVAAYVG